MRDWSLPCEWLAEAAVWAARGELAKACYFEEIALAGVDAMRDWERL